MIKRFIASLLVVLGLSITFVFATPTQAAGVFSGACPKGGAANSSAFCTDQGKTSNPITGKNGTLYKVSKILASVAALTAVIMMIVGGFMYVLSDGDAGKIATARNTLIYAGVGLVIIGVAQGIIALIVNSISTK